MLFLLLWFCVCCSRSHHRRGHRRVDVFRRRGLAKQRLLQEELNLSRQDAVMIKANETKRRNRFQALEDTSLDDSKHQEPAEHGTLSVDF